VRKAHLTAIALAKRPAGPWSRAEAIASAAAMGIRAFEQPERR